MVSTKGNIAIVSGTVASVAAVVLFINHDEELKAIAREQLLSFFETTEKLLKTYTKLASRAIDAHMSKADYSADADKQWSVIEEKLKSRA